MLFGFLALAVVDSINPSAIAITLYLLSRERVAAQVLVLLLSLLNWLKNAARSPLASLRVRSPSKVVSVRAKRNWASKR